MRDILFWPILFAMITTLVSCSGKPLESRQTNNVEYSVSLLFENEGCKVYRFEDGGRWVYYTNCTSTSYEEPCGKTSIPQQVNTYRRESWEK